MIEKISGEFIARLTNSVVVDVKGVGYCLEVPLSVMCKLPPIGSVVSFWTHTYVREDAIKLFGFLDYRDRVAFELLIGLNGVGPKVALAILSTLSVDVLRKAVESGQNRILQGVPGIGPRVAERIVLELKNKLKKLSPPIDLGLVEQTSSDENFTLEGAESTLNREQELFDDLYSALENLGFKEAKIAAVLTEIRSTQTCASFPELMRSALKILGGQSSEASTQDKLDLLF